MSEWIQWPRAKYWDRPWNPIVGCKAASPACANCYARTAMVGRFGQSFEPHPTKKQTPPRKGVVFCGNMTDLFGEWRTCGEMAQDVMYAWKGDPCQPHTATYLWLTKRTGRMMAALEYAGKHTFWPDKDLAAMYSNHYFGFTAEDQTHYAERLLPVYEQREDWMQCWVSCEPLLGPIDLRLKSEAIRKNIKWVVVGCESGPDRRPCGMGWVESIAAQCMHAKIPLFIKQLDLNGRCETDINKFPAHLRIRQVPWAKKGEE